VLGNDCRRCKPALEGAQSQFANAFIDCIAISAGRQTKPDIVGVLPALHVERIVEIADQERTIAGIDGREQVHVAGDNDRHTHLSVEIVHDHFEAVAGSQTILGCKGAVDQHSRRVVRQAIHQRTKRLAGIVAAPVDDAGQIHAINADEPGRDRAIGKADLDLTD
jgi:hypothetical protein